MAKQQQLICTFCGRKREEVKILIAGLEGHICENCVEHAKEIIAHEIPHNNKTTSTKTRLFKSN